MKNRWFLFMLSCLLCTVRSFATMWDVNSAATLNSSYSSSVDGDTLRFTAGIVVSATFTISKSLVILGQGYSISVPNYGVTDGGALNSSASTFRPITISGTNKSVRIYNLGINGGSTANAGCIYNPSSDTLTLVSCSVSNGKGTTNAGGLYNAGVCYLTNSIIRRNAAPYGGGFLNTGSTAKMFIQNSSITDNRSLATNGGGGGAEINSSSTVYINNSTISSNQSTELGGALNINGSSTVYITNSSFTGNITYADSYKGGAVACNNATVYLVSCLFGYNYYKSAGSSGTPTAPTTLTLDDVHGYAGTVNMYYCTYMATSVASGTINMVVGNTSHTLAADGSADDLFTGGDYTNMMGTDGSIYGTAKYFQPYLIKISGLPMPTLKTGSFALTKGTTTRFGNTSVNARIGYYNKSTSTWADLTGTTATSDLVTSDEGGTARPTLPSYPAAGAVERTVSSYYSLKVFSSANGIVSGASAYGDLYAAGQTVTFTAVPNTGYTFANFTYVEGGSGTVTNNPMTVTMNANLSFNMNFNSTTGFTVTYLSNNATSGSVPSPGSQTYSSGATATISGNTGNLAKTNFVFNNWNTAPNGSGTSYSSGGSYSSTSAANLTLYANWTSTGVALPIVLKQFDVSYADQKATALLTWTVSDDDNCQLFEISRSADGANFEKIGVVNSLHQASEWTYTFEDAAPLNGKNYYRVSAVLLSGQVEYYPVRYLDFHNGSIRSSDISIFPNPVKDNLVYITLPAGLVNENIRYVITDLSGKDIQMGSFVGQRRQTLPLKVSTSQLLALCLYWKDQSVILKVIKN